MDFACLGFFAGLSILTIGAIHIMDPWFKREKP